MLARVVSYTERGDGIRLITARLATGNERRQYDEQTRGTARSSDRMEPGYDLGKGSRGKHAYPRRMRYKVVVLAPDVACRFPTADNVNETFGAVARLMKHRQRNRKHWKNQALRAR